MRKLVILICILITGGAVYALMPSLFPDNSLFPRIPTAEGTIGGILEKLLTRTITDASQDGTVKNSMKLDGLMANQYLKNTDCYSQGKTWTGVDMNGKAVCGTSNPILADYGTISEQGCTATVYHANGTFTNASNTGDTLKSGDIVKTQNIPNCTLTIAFADFSILRLDADTTVSLDVLAPAAPSTQTIASAILENGSLWGRILTDTGSYSIGTDKIVAGVRGTSISLVSTGNALIIGTTMSASGWIIGRTPTPSYNTELAIVDSTLDAGSATVYCRGNSGIPTVLSSLSPENQYSIATSGVGCLPNAPPRALTSTAATLYARSPWIRSNTQKDVRYMYRLLALSGSSIPNITKVNTELTNSQPPDNPLDTENMNICEPTEKWWTPRYGCQPRTLYAIADYTLPIISGVSQVSIPLTNPTTLIYSGSSGIVGLPEISVSVHPPAGINGVEITQTGQYIQYQDSLFISKLVGRAITIEMTPPPSSTSSIPNGVILDVGSVCKVSWKKAIQQWSNGGGLCPIITNTPTKLVVQLPSTGIMQFYIGNNSSLSGPIGTTIQKILIQ